MFASASLPQREEQRIAGRTYDGAGYAPDKQASPVLFDTGYDANGGYPSAASIPPDLSTAGALASSVNANRYTSCGLASVRPLHLDTQYVGNNALLQCTPYIKQQRGGITEQADTSEERR